MEELYRLLNAGHRHLCLSGLQGGSPAYVAARAAAETKRPLLYIAPSERLAELAVQDISLFSPLPVILYPGFDIPPYTPLSPDPATVAERINALYRILTAEGPLILVASCESLLRGGAEGTGPEPGAAGLRECLPGPDHGRLFRPGRHCRHFPARL